MHLLACPACTTTAAALLSYAGAAVAFLALVWARVRAALTVTSERTDA